MNGPSPGDRAPGLSRALDAPPVQVERTLPFRVRSFPLSDACRFDFGNPSLLGGLSIVSVVVGLFAVSEAAFQIQEGHLDALSAVQSVEVPFRSLSMTLENERNLLRQSTIGTVFGALPGASGMIASCAASAVAKARSDGNETCG